MRLYHRTMASIEANGITIEYQIDGDSGGDPVLLIMGLGGQLIDWTDDTIKGLVDRGYQVIRFDNRDAGLSTEFDWETPGRVATVRNFILRRRPEAGYTVNDMADDAQGLLHGLGIESAHVVGVSMGGMIAQSMAIRHRLAVRSLTSIMSNTGDQKHGLPSLRFLLKAARLGQPSRENAVEVAVEFFGLMSGPHYEPDVARDKIRQSVERSWRPDGIDRQSTAVAASPDRTAALAAVDAPTLVIHGLLDPLVKPSGGLATARAVPDSRLLMFPDMGHALPRPRLDEILDAIHDNAQRATIGPPA